MGKIYDTVTEDIKYFGFNFRINDLDERLEIKFNSADWEPLDDTKQAYINLKMKEIGYGAKKKGKCAISTMWEAIITYGDVNRFNPISNYFDQIKNSYKLGKHNEYNIPIPYLIPNFTEYFYNPDGMFGLWLFKFMVGAVAKAYTGKRNPMLVLAGSQHIGKSTFAEWLCPIIGRFIRGGIYPDNKDHKLRLANLLLWEVDEVASTTTRRDANAIKSFISQSEIYERLPYTKHPIKKTARCSFIGTANPDGSGFLNDPTGSTRFLTCTINNIDFNYSKVDVNSLWSEAAWFYHNYPHCSQLNPKQDKKREQLNNQFEREDILEEIIDNHFDFSDKSHFMTSTQIENICTGLYRVPSSTIFYNKLAQILYRKGVKRHRQKHSEGGLRGWLGVKSKTTEAKF